MISSMIGTECERRTNASGVYAARIPRASTERASSSPTLARDERKTTRRGTLMRAYPGAAALPPRLRPKAKYRGGSDLSRISGFLLLQRFEQLKEPLTNAGSPVGVSAALVRPSRTASGTLRRTADVDRQGTWHGTQEEKKPRLVGFIRL